MNKARRKRLGEAIELIGKAQDILCSVREEEQEAYENLPDNFRDGEKRGRDAELHGHDRGSRWLSG